MSAPISKASMRSDAQSFSPRASREDRATEHALILHNGDVQRAAPHHLIVHESIKGLVTALGELKERCTALEAENTRLAQRLDELARSFLSKEHALASARNNLTGYTSSNGSEAERSPQATFTSDMQDAIAKLFQVHQNNIDDQSRFTQKLDARLSSIEETRQAEPTMEASRLKKIEARLNLIDGRLLTREPATTSPTDPYFMDQIDTLNSKINELDTKFDVVAEVAQADSALRRDGAGESPGIPSEVAFQMACMKEEIDELRQLLDRAQEQRRMERDIDEAATKDALYRMFHELTKLMKDDGERHGDDRFEGTFDEVFAMRSRVVRRLAGFDASFGAFEEAKKAEIF